MGEHHHAKGDVWLQATKAHKVYYAPCLCEAAPAIGMPMQTSASRQRGRGPAIVWHDELPFSPSVFRHLPGGSILNRLNGMQAMARKAYLTVMIRFLRTLFPERFDFYPLSWCIPSEIGQFRESVEAKLTYIVKPDGGCRGQDIFLVRGDQDLPPILSASASTKQAGARAKPLEFVVQEYIDPPRLIGGHKFDIRIYVLVESVYPLRACIGTKALVRIASMPYESPTPANLTETRMHLTNASLIEADGTVDPSELASWKREWSESAAEIGDVDDLWQQFRTIVTRTLIAMQPHVLLCTEAVMPLVLGTVAKGKRKKLLHKMFFQLLGFDIMVTHSGEAALLEVNHNPSFALTTPLDRSIKVPILAATLARMQSRLGPAKAEPDTSGVLEQLCFEPDDDVLLAVAQVTRTYQLLTTSACADAQSTSVPAEFVRRLSAFLANTQAGLSSALLHATDSETDELSFRGFISALIHSVPAAVEAADSCRHISLCMDLVTRFVKSTNVQGACD